MERTDRVKMPPLERAPRGLSSTRMVSQGGKGGPRDAGPRISRKGGDAEKVDTTAVKTSRENLQVQKMGD